MSETNGTAPTRVPSTWTRWVYKSGPSMLAAYTTTSAVEELGLVLRDSYDRLDPPSPSGSPNPSARSRSAMARILLSELFAKLAALDIPYNTEADPWGQDDGQVIRDLHSMKRTSGTCLDFVTAFAAMCKANNLRPMPVLVTLPSANCEGREDANGEGSSEQHALIIVNLRDDPSRTLSPKDCADLLNPKLSPATPRQLDSSVPQAEAAATLLASAQDTEHWTQPDDWIAVDIVQAARVSYAAASDNNSSAVNRPDLTPEALALRFAEACADGMSHLLRAIDAQVIDVCEAHRHGVPEYPVPVNRDRLALHTNLPAFSGFIEYSSRRKIVDDLLSRRGTVVLLGPSGTGKSWLARRVAGEVAQQCGWWIDASSAATLTSGLAAAEAAESGRDPAAVVESADVAADAARAWLRLRTAEGPWTVVLDNADGDPKDLGKLPTPRSANQLLLVTTTNSAWRTVPGVDVVDVPVLPDEDLQRQLGDHIPEPVWRALDGRPLLAAATVRFNRHTGKSWWADRIPRGEQGGAPAQIWAAVRQYLGTDSEEAAVARAVGLLPPSRIPVSALRERFPSAEQALTTLDSLGLLEISENKRGMARSVRTAQMHRLFRAAIREARDDSDVDWIALASGLLRDAQSREVLETAYDPQTSEALYALVADRSRPADERARDLHLLGRSIERHDSRSAGTYLKDVLEDLSWSPGDPVGAVPAGQRLLVVDALRTLARPMVREPASGETREQAMERLDRALSLLRQADRLCSLFEADAEDDADVRDCHFASARTRALHGIALRQYAGIYKRHDRERARDLLSEAERMLKDSLETRMGLAEGENRHDVDRAEFNLAGIYVAWAQLDAKERAAEHLAKAEAVYRNVHRRRLERYQTEEFEDVVTCVNGFAIVDFYRAVLLDPEPAERLRLLRNAVSEALRAAEIRARLYEVKPDARPGIDGPDAAKSLTLAAKALAARAAVDGVPPERPIRDFLTEWMALPAESWWILDLADEQSSVIAVPESATASFKKTQMLRPGPGLLDQIAGWCAGPPIARLLESFGDPEQNLSELLLSAKTDLPGYLARLDAFTDRWDTRQGRERNAADELPMTLAQTKLVLSAARALGLRDPGSPEYAEYDYVLVLGGLVRACLARPDYAARLLNQERTRAGALVALGARRPLSGDEPGLAAEAGLRSPVEGEFGEFEVLDQGVRRALQLGDPVDVVRTRSTEPFGGSEVRTYQASSGLRVVVASAPSSEPGKRRADTADTYRWFAENLAHLEAGQRILAITTDIYRTSQHATALRLLALPYGVEVDTVGHVPARSEPAVRQAFSPTKYLLEIRSTVRALRALVGTLDGGQVSGETGTTRYGGS